MRRRAYMGGVTAVATLAVGLAACTGDGGGAEDDDAKSGGSSSSVPSPEPGSYQNLPEPCGSVEQSTLRNVLLPNENSTSGTPAAPEGTPDVTYDIDRRVGCRWKSATSLGSHHLTVDFERVVSYDPAVSDNDKATKLYDAKALEDEIPAMAPTTDETPDSPTGDATQRPAGSGTPGTPEDTPDTSSRTPETGETGDDAGSGEAADGTGQDISSSSDPALAPRPLSDIGDTAYLNDKLITADSGVHRDITLVFRTGNVITTIEYDQWSTDKRRLPDSAELQKRAQTVAKQLAERFDS